MTLTNSFMDIDRIIRDRFSWGVPFFARSESFNERIAQLERELSILKLQKAEAEKRPPSTPSIQSRSVVEHYYSDHAGKPYHIRQRTINGEEYVETIHGEERSRSWRPDSSSNWTPASDDNQQHFESLWNVPSIPSIASC